MSDGSASHPQASREHIGIWWDLFYNKVQPSLNAAMVRFFIRRLISFFLRHLSQFSASTNLLTQKETNQSQSRLGIIQ